MGSLWYKYKPTGIPRNNQQTAETNMADEFLKKVLESFRAKSKEILNDFRIKRKENGRPVRACDIAEASVLSIAAFPISVGYLQTAIFRPLRITNNRRLIGPVFGFFSVAFSGSIASLLFVLYVNFSKDISTRAFESYKQKLDSLVSPIQYSYSHYDVLLYSIASVIVFKALGGRFRSVLPSSLVHPGAFARVSLPAPGQLYASDATREKLTKLGRKYGCHSCGTKRSPLFIGDHMPPNKLVKPRQKQRFFPQCTNCSKDQGISLSVNSKKLPIKTHATTLRLYHLWLPVPAYLMWLRNDTDSQQ